MQDQGARGYDAPVDAPIADGRVMDRPIATDRVVGYAPSPGIRIGENELEVRDRVRWGPILAGVVVTLAAMLILSVLGLALGASVLDRNAPGEEIGTWAAIWGAASAVVAFFLGGAVAAKSAAVGGAGTGMLNGLISGCAALALILWLTAIGAGNLFGTTGAGLADVQTAVLDQAEGVNADPGDDLRASFAEAEDAAWVTLGGLVLPLGVAAIGGLIAHNKRRDLIEGTR